MKDALCGLWMLLWREHSELAYFASLSISAISLIIVCSVGVLLVALELISLKNRRARAYHALLRQARARLSEMRLRVD